MRDTASLIGLQVIGVNDGKLVGRVTQVVCDLARGALVGLITGEGAAEKGVLAEDIAVIGEDAVMVPSAEVAKPLSEQPELLARRREPGRPLEVVTDEGRRIGRVTRIWIDPYAKQVTRYEVSTGLLQDLRAGPLSLPILPGTVHGEDTVIVPAAELAQLAGRAGGVLVGMRKFAARVQEQAATARQRAAEAAQATRARLEKAVELAREHLPKPPKPAPAAEEAAAPAPAPAEAQPPAAPEAEAGRQQGGLEQPRGAEEQGQAAGEETGQEGGAAPAGPQGDEISACETGDQPQVPSTPEPTGPVEQA
jgi:uncharacterized protein YrrD